MNDATPNHAIPETRDAMKFGQRWKELRSDAILAEGDVYVAYKPLKKMLKGKDDVDVTTVHLNFKFQLKQQLEITDNFYRVKATPLLCLKGHKWVLTLLRS